MKLPTIDELRHTILRPVDFHFARLLGSYAGKDSEAVEFAAAMVSRALGDGHTALDLQPGTLVGQELRFNHQINVTELAERLVAEPQLCADASVAAATPLVIDNNRLYLRRYWQFEQQIAQQLAVLIAARPNLPMELGASLSECFEGGLESNKDQVLALAIALSRQFAIITGGPGTGKTSTVARLLALQIEANEKNPTAAEMQIALAAPTGKAAARMTESLLRQLDSLERQGRIGERMRHLLPNRAVTLHRLLGARFGGEAFNFRADNPLPVDLLIIDEASMIDLRMMHSILQALPAQAKLILLGDRDQLDAVEAGNVFGELCRDAGKLSSQRAIELETLLGFSVASDVGATLQSDAIAVLQHSFRFDQQGEIGRLASSVKEGDVQTANLCLQNSSSELSIIPMHDGDTGNAVRIAAEACGNVLKAIHKGASPDTALEMREQFQLLCALRHGPFGVDGLNHAIENVLTAEGLLSGSHSPPYHGQPIIISRNDKNLNLHNGDMGVILAAEEGVFEAWFLRSGVDNDSLQHVPVIRLPPYETAYAMTVHKAQGSEFDHVLLMMPDTEPAFHAPGAQALLCREWVYTGITRARQRLTLAMPGTHFDPAWLRETQRSSGLSDALRRMS